MDHLSRRLQELGCRVRALECSFDSHVLKVKTECVRPNALSTLPSALEQRLRSIEGERRDVQGTAGKVISTCDKEGGAATLVAAELRDRAVDTAVFIRVPEDYYDHDLEYRRHCLSAVSVEHVCKSIVMENTKAPPDFRDCGGLEDSRYYCVIVQYVARLHADKLKRYIHKLNGKLGIKNFNMRLAPSNKSEALTGYSHNAVTPICMKTRLPIFMSDRIEKLQPSHFWLGAGEVDLKVGMSARQFIQGYHPRIIDCTYNNEAPAPNASSLSETWV